MRSSRRAGWDETRVKVAATGAASAVNLGLGILKLYAGVFTNSISIISDGINNFGDVFSNAGAAVGFGVEHRRPSERFPFGFGRLEYVMTFVMAAIVLVVGGVFVYSAMDRLFNRQIVTFAWTQFWIVFATVFVKAGLAVVFGLLYKKIPSEVLKAQCLDSILDMLTTVFALLGLFLYRYISFPVDAVIALGISVALIVSGVKLIAGALGKLMGSRDARADGLQRLCEAQRGVDDAEIKVYDLGRKRADAYVRLAFAEDAGEEDKAEAMRKITAVAAKNGIAVAFVREHAEVPLRESEGDDACALSSTDTAAQKEEK